MYQYLRAVGYRHYPSKSKAMLDFLNRMKGSSQVTILRPAPQLGIKLYSNPLYADQVIERILPFAEGDDVITPQDLSIEECAYGGYYGVMEDPKNLLLLPFTCVNSENVRPGFVENAKVSLHALSVKGKVILSAQTNRQECVRYSATPKNFLQRNTVPNEPALMSKDQLIQYIKEQDATTQKFWERMKSETVYQIIETTMMPYGMDCTQYHVVGKICAVTEIKNEETGDLIYCIHLEAYQYRFPIYINKRDLLGDPAAGLRFKGNIQLQGVILH